MTLADRLSHIHENLKKTSQTAPLARPHIAVLGASKGQPSAIIEEAIAAGLTLFGENRVQEAQEKWPALRQKHPHIALHLIGPLQTNKVKDALALFDVIQTLDREKLALAVSSLQSQVIGDTVAGDWRLATKSYYIQVNTGGEPQKSGILPKEADEFIRYCMSDLKLPVTGLMCVPPADQPPAAHFAWLRAMAEKHGLAELSMGMSGDYEIAARLGSSCVRLGTALFGSR